MPHVANRSFEIWLRLAALLLILALGMPILPGFEAQAESDGMIRVKLTRLGNVSSVSFELGCAYAVNGKSDCVLPGNSNITVTAENGALILSCGGKSQNMGTSFALARGKSGNVGVQFTVPSLGNIFAGDLRFSVASGCVVVILNIFLEDYLLGVVGYEMSNSYPLEALKAQAVAARTYALRQKSGRASAAYDVTDNASSQVYRGYNSSQSRVHQAVRETKGLVAYYGNALAACYYSASNGGQTESTKNAWGNSLKYAVVKDDPYDLESSAACKTAFIARDASGLKPELLEALCEGAAQALTSYNLDVPAEAVTIDAIHAVVAHSPKFSDPSRLYRQLRFSLEATVIMPSGERMSGKLEVNIPTYGGLESWYGLSINSSDNETVQVVETDQGFEVRFRRNGHGVGLSQCGAKVMAEKYGMSFGDILTFYYPGVCGKTLSLSDTTGSFSPPAATPSVSPEPTPSAAPEATPSAASDGLKALSQVKAYRVSSSVSLYAQPDASANSLDTLWESEIVNVYALSSRWARVMTRSGQRGYVPRKYLLLPTSGNTYGMLKKQCGLYPRAYDTSDMTEPLSSGSYVLVLAYGDDTAYCQSRSGQKGYLPLSMLKKVSGREANSTKIIRANFSAATIVSTTAYASDSASSAKLGTLPWGAKVAVLAYNSIWAYVQYGSNKGFVYRHTLEKQN